MRVCVCVCVCMCVRVFIDIAYLIEHVSGMNYKVLFPFSGAGVAFGVIVVLSVALLLVLSIVWSASHCSLMH